MNTAIYESTTGAAIYDTAGVVYETLPEDNKSVQYDIFPAK